MYFLYWNQAVATLKNVFYKHVLNCNAASTGYGIEKYNFLLAHNEYLFEVSNI